MPGLRVTQKRAGDSCGHIDKQTRAGEGLVVLAVVESVPEKIV